jgi:outer membrane protein assembly factor BamB
LRPSEDRLGPRPKYLLLSLVSLLLLAGCARGFQAAGGWSGVADGGDVVYVGTMEGQLLELDAHDGTQPRSFPEERDQGDKEPAFGAIYGTPTVVMNRIYVAGFNGKVYVLDRETLQPAGRDSLFEVDGEKLSKGVVGSVIVADGKAIFTAGEDSESGRLYVLDAESFQEVCRYPGRDEPPIGKAWSTPVVVDGVAYWGDLSHHLYAVSIEDCVYQWSVPVELGGAIASTPVVLDGKMYVGAFDRYFYMVDLATGQADRLFKAGGWFWSGSATDGRTLFVPNLDGKLYAVDAASGETVWEFDTRGAIHSTPVMVDGQVVVASDANTLYVLDAQSGTEIWNIRVDGQVRAPLMARGGVVYVSTMAHTIDAVDISEGRGHWRQSVNTKE